MRWISARRAMRPLPLTALSVLPALILALALLGGCSKPTGRVVSANIGPIRDVPESLRGTIGAQAEIVGTEPTLVSGYGLVVGLNETGGGIVPEQVGVHMERYLGQMGVGSASNPFHGTPLEGLTPRQVLGRRDVAVVLVYAAVPPGAPTASTFDVFVMTLPNSGVSSLEGGYLLRTELRVGRPALFGGGQSARIIAEAHGDVYINPYSEPGREQSGVVRTTGRILNGGSVTSPLSAVLILDHRSHTRATAITQGLNTRFPMRPGDRQPVARGRDDHMVVLTVPDRYTDRPEEFFNLVRAMPVEYMDGPVHARRYTEALKSEHELAPELSVCLQAIGPASLEFVRPLYDSPLPVTRFYALQAGAKLGDPRASPHLREIAAQRDGAFRIDAIELMEGIARDVRVDEALRGLVAEPELTVRVVAYEALARRAERTFLNMLIEREGAGRSISAAKRRAMEELASRMLPPGTLQGVVRMEMGRPPGAQTEGKFLLDVVPSGDPLIYVAQQGQPRIVVFGEGIQVQRPLFFEAWSNRFMLRAESESDDIRVYYELPWAEGQPRGPVARGLEVGADLVEFIEFLSRRPAPGDSRPGLDLTYSQVVGILHAMAEAGAIDAGFATEEDQLRARVLNAWSVMRQPDRPETDRPAPEYHMEDGFLSSQDEQEEPAERPRARSLVVPLRERQEQGSPSRRP